MHLSRIDINLIKLIDQLSSSQKEDLVNYIEEVLKGETIMATSQGIEMYNLELDQAMQNVKDGNYISLEELEKEMESW
jgi:hypothetical protein